TPALIEPRLSISPCLDKIKWSTRRPRPPRTCEQARNIHHLAEIRDAGNNMSAVAAITREHDNRLACLSLSHTGGDKIDRRAWHSATRERERAKHSSIGGNS